MSFPLRIAVLLIFISLQLVASEEPCVWCRVKTENDFLNCVSDKIFRNPELNIQPYVVKAMTESLRAASAAINTPKNIKLEIMNGAFAGEVAGMVSSNNSPGRNKNDDVTKIMGLVEECYIAITGLSSARFTSSITKTVNLMLEDLEATDSNEYNQSPEIGFRSNNDYPNSSPFTENSPNKAFPVIQTQKNIGIAQQMPLQPLPPSAESPAASLFPQTHEFVPNVRPNTDNRVPFQPLPPSAESVPTSSFPQTREFVPNAKPNPDNRAPFQSFPSSAEVLPAATLPQTREFVPNTVKRKPFQSIRKRVFLSPRSHDSTNVIKPQNENNYVPFRKVFQPSDSFTSFNDNVPKNGNKDVPFRESGFQPSNSFVSSNANVPKNGDKDVSFREPGFQPSNSFVSSNANSPQNGGNYVPFRDDFKPSDSFAPSNTNVPQNGVNYAPLRDDFKPSDSFASSNTNVPQNGGNYVPLRDDFKPPDSFASSNANAPQIRNNYVPFQGIPPVFDTHASVNSNVGPNGDNYEPYNNYKPFLQKNSQPIPQNALQSASITPDSSQSPFVPFLGAGVDSKYPDNDRIYTKKQFTNTAISTVEQNISSHESNADENSRTSLERKNNTLQNYPNYAETNVYKGENIELNEYYNDYENNRWDPNPKPTYGLFPQDNNYNSINRFPLQENLPNSYQPLNSQSEYQNFNNQFTELDLSVVTNSGDKGNGVVPPKSSEDAFTLQQSPKQGYNDPSNRFSLIEEPQSDYTDFGKRQPTSNEGTLAIAQNNFREGPQIELNRQPNFPGNDDSISKNDLNSEDTATQTTTVFPAQASFTSETTKDPATSETNVNSNKSRAIEFAEAIFVNLSENDSFNCVLNEDTPHDKATLIASDAIKNAFINAGLPNQANQAKKYCKRQFSQLSTGASSQKYAEKMSKSATIVVYKNDLLDENCKEAGKFMAEKILNAILDISDSFNAADNDQGKEAPENENKNPAQSNDTPSLAAATAAVSEGRISASHNKPQLDNLQDTASPDSLAAPQIPERGALVNNYPQNRLRIKKRRRKYPGISLNTPDDVATSSSDETNVSPQNLKSGIPDYYNNPQLNNAPSLASETASIGGAPDHYNEPQSDNIQDTGYPGSLAVSQIPERGDSINKYPQNKFLNRLRDKNGRRKYLGVSVNAPDDANGGDSSNGETPQSPQNSYGGIPNSYESPRLNNAQNSALVVTIFEGSSGENPNNYNNVPNVPTFNDQQPEESVPDKSGISNSKENPLLNQFEDSDSKRYIQHLMETAKNCVSPERFDYKKFILELAWVATEMKKEHPDKSLEVIMNDANLVAIVALIEVLKNTMFDRQENNAPQSTQESQPPLNFNRLNSYSDGYETSTNFQNSGSSAKAGANSQSAPIGYQNGGNYQNTFQTESVYGNVLQTNMNPTLQNLGQSRWDISNAGNGLLIAAPSNLSPNFGNNQNEGLNSDSARYEPSTYYQDSGSSAIAMVNSQAVPIGNQNDVNYQNTLQTEPLNGNTLQTNINPISQNVGQSRWDMNYDGNNFSNQGPRDLSPNFDNNQNRGSTYTASG